MPTARRSRTVPAPPERVWEIVGDPHHLPRWWPRVQRVESVTDEHFTEVRPLFMNVMVVSVDQHTMNTHETVVNDPNSPGAGGGGAPGEVKTVTLALPPPNAQQLVLAQQLGQIWLLLRAKGDNAPHTYEIWNNERLLGAANRLWRAQDNQAAMMRKIAAGAAR